MKKINTITAAALAKKVDQTNKYFTSNGRKFVAKAVFGHAELEDGIYVYEVLGHDNIVVRLKVQG